METTTKPRYFYTAIAAAVLATTTASFAAMDKQNDAMAIESAKVTLSQAVSTAEQHVGGNAVRAEYEPTKAGWAYDVEVVNGTKVFDVRVDANSGTVLSSNEDQADHDDHDMND